MSATLRSTKPQSPVEFGQRAKRVGGRATGRVTKKQWLDTALSVLVSDGVDGVSVLNLSKRLNISKSGFYWHFENRDNLLEEMKRYWSDEFSQQIISEVMGREASLQEKLLTVVLRVRERQSGKYDLAFTSWGHRDASVRELVDQIRDIRISFIKGLLAEGGYTGDELEARARLFVIYFSWSEVMFGQGAERLEGEPLEQILRLIAS